MCRSETYVVVPRSMFRFEETKRRDTQVAPYDHARTGLGRPIFKAQDQKFHSALYKEERGLKKLLIVDDEDNIRDIIVKYAVFYGYSVDEAENGRIAVEKCRQNAYSVVIMDIMMPELDGFSAVREIRGFSSVPIIMLSARSEDRDKISGFEFGIDDYVEKPFSPKLLMLRVAAILKRTSAVDDDEADEVYCFEGLRVDISARIVTVDGARVDMSPKEYDLLFYMVRNRGIALSREKLITQVWGYDYYGDDRTLDTHIKLLRKSLGAYSRLIVTLRGVGYRFERSETEKR